jgi:transcriptional regulator with XRE-family HTH domain
MFVGERIKLIRESKGMSQIELARKANVSNIYLSNLENGIKNNPSNKLLVKIADALNVTIDDFNSDKEDEKNIYEMIEEILKKNNMHNEETQVAALLLAKLRSNNLINEDFEMTPSLVKLLEEAIRLDAKIEKNIKNAEDE